MKPQYMPVFAFLLSCGQPAAIDQYVGTWGGTGGYFFGNGVSVELPITIVVTADGSSGVISGFCPDGGGAMAPVSGTIGWTGSTSCPGIYPLAWCDSVRLTYTSADISLIHLPGGGDQPAVSPAALFFSATGNSTGCSQSVTVTTNFPY